MIYLASDHAGFELKARVIKQLERTNYEFKDCGVFDNKSSNYALVGASVCPQIGDGDRGIFICGTGIGMSMIANRFSHIRAALCNNAKTAIIARKHNDANVLVLGARSRTIIFKYRNIISKFLKTEFEGDRHIDRIKELSKWGSRKNVDK